MKNILYSLVIFFTLSLFSHSAYAISCDQTFEGTFLRYNKTYRFYDTMTNGTSSNVYVNTREIRFMDNMSSNRVMTSSYLDPGSAFDWTQTLKNASYKLNPGQSMRIIETGSTKWRVDRKPSSRTNATKNNHDFMIYYKVGYDFSNNYPNASDDIQHVECQYFSVTSCGDGVRDAGYEVCDPSDPTQTGWGNGGCNNSCEPIVVAPVSTCDSITATPMTGKAPFNTNITCSGTNANTYQIQCGNGQVINSRTGQCSYATGSNYQAQCIVNGNITGNQCKKTIVVTNPNPGIRIDKLDANDDDIDGNVGNDTQTVAKTTRAVFKIRVTNSGDEALKDLSVADLIAPNCAGLVTLPNTKPSTWSDFVVAGQGNHSNNTLEPGEYYEYTCEKGNTQSAYDNEATTRGTGITSGTVVSDHNETEVKIITPDIQVVKIDANSNDRDTVQGDDTQSVRTGESAVFSITVRNNGTEDLKNIVLTDTRAGACDSNGAFVNLSGNSFVNKSGTTVGIIVTGNGNHNDNIFQIGEVFTYKCEKGNTTAAYTNIVEVDGIGVDSNVPVSDDDPSEVIINDTPDTYDLALKKILSGATPGPFKKGDSVTFSIRVENQGTIDAANIEITDYIPTGLTLNDAAWTQSGSTAVRTIASLPSAGAPVNLDITFTIADNAPSSISNYAEISRDNGDDCDSDPDNRNGNGVRGGNGETTNLIDNEIGSGCNDGGDEDDHDIETITVENGVVAVCNTLTASPASSVSTLTSTLTCTGTNVASYKIEVKDATGNIINTINQNTGRVTFSTVGTYTARCFVNDTTTSNTCEKTLTVTPPTSSSSSTSSSGGSPARCTDIIDNPGNSYTCWGNNRTQSIAMKCGTDGVTGDDIYLTPKTGAALNRETTGARTAQFTCSDPFPRCYVKKTVDSTFSVAEIGTSGSNKWITEDRCQIQTNPICGDGIVQPERGEQCDMGADNGKPGFACSTTCKLPTSSSSGGSSSGNPGPKISTTPRGGEIKFGPEKEIIVGHKQNVLAKVPAWPYIENTSEYDYSFDELCVKKTAGDASVNRVSGDEECVSLQNKMLYGFNKLAIVKDTTDNSYKAVSYQQVLDNQARYAYPDFISNKNAIPAGQSYGSAKITTSIKDDIDNNGSLDDLYNAYFAADLNVRVAKPAVVTIGGGTSYVKSNTSGDVSKVTQGIAGYSDNKNFVGTSVSTGGISSYSENNTDTAVINDVAEEKTQYTKDVTSVTTDTASTLENVSGYDKFDNYNGFKNVFIIKGKNITLGSLPTLSESTTYIVEGGDLTLSQDIISGNRNVAFVVKGGDIIIEDQVERLDGTYIAIPSSGVGGEIISEESEKQLVVYGSLSGDIDRLVDNRIFLEKSGNQLSPGTIVSFGSKLFSDTAPLVGKFKSEYLETQKVAK